MRLCLRALTVAEKPPFPASPPGTPRMSTDAQACDLVLQEPGVDRSVRVTLAALAPAHFRVPLLLVPALARNTTLFTSAPIFVPCVAWGTQTRNTSRVCRTEEQLWVNAAWLSFLR